MASAPNISVSCVPCFVALTVPLALFLLLAETAVGGFATVAYVHSRVGLTRGFLKFIAATYTVVAGLGLLTVLAGPPGSYGRVLNISPAAAATLGLLQTFFLLAMLVQAWDVFRRGQVSRWTWGVGLVSSVLLLAGVTATLAPLAGSLLDGLAVALTVFLSAVVLGSATTGMLLGHWYLVTPTLTNRPLLRMIVILLAALVAQALIYPLALAGLTGASRSLTHALDVSPGLSVLWLLGAVALPLLATGLALPTCRLRSFMSTTGLLYLAMIAVLPGQLIGQLLLFVAAA